MASAPTRPTRPAARGVRTTPAPPAGGDPLFTAVDAPAFTARHLARLASGTLAAVRVPRFLGPAGCRAVTEALDRLPTAPYDPGRVPTPVLRFGPALNDYRLPSGGLDAERYWAEADAARTAWERAAISPDPVAHALDRLGEAWGAPVEPATIGGRAAFGGTAREINAGLLMHYDDINREFPCGLFDQDVIAQLAFNLYVSVASGGGATTVWRHRWDPADEEHRDAYGYRPRAVEGSQCVELPPHLGDGLLFCPAHFHAVAANEGAGRRIAFAFFLGLTSGGRLVVWS
ncbi:L-gamma-glutamyl-L-propargylglycine hydroxylase BesE [Streptomyces sp. enrichment culture]|uniref:L-gamma-glutamyl-L-propargylglycine hydroxylase BesE n=1 Tax=Streptomyces sp. enrichment culture TaxID=1795815 RepID=UPI003F5549AD